MDSLGRNSHLDYIISMEMSERFTISCNVCNQENNKSRPAPPVQVFQILAFVSISCYGQDIRLWMGKHKWHYRNSLHINEYSTSLSSNGSNSKNPSHSGPRDTHGWFKEEDKKNSPDALTKMKSIKICTRIVAMAIAQPTVRVPKKKEYTTTRRRVTHV